MQDSADGRECGDDEVVPDPYAVPAAMGILTTITSTCDMTGEMSFGNPFSVFSLDNSSVHEIVRRIQSHHELLAKKCEL